MYARLSSCCGESYFRLFFQVSIFTIFGSRSAERPRFLIHILQSHNHEFADVTGENSFYSKVLSICPASCTLQSSPTYLFFYYSAKPTQMQGQRGLDGKSFFQRLGRRHHNTSAEKKKKRRRKTHITKEGGVRPPPYTV